MATQSTTNRNASAERSKNPIAIFVEELNKYAPATFAPALPDHIPLDRFIRVVQTAVQRNPELLECDRKSLFEAAVLAAQDGILPDGREGVILVRRSKNGKMASYQIMIQGIRKKARNTGEIATWETYLIHENDDFHIQLGDDPKIHHVPLFPGDRGAIVGAYSIAVMKSGEKSREIMSIEEIEGIRNRSDGWKAFKDGKIRSTPWSTDPGEMMRKTVAKRHAKALPLSTDLERVLRREDDEDFDPQTGELLGGRAAPKTIEHKPEKAMNQLDTFAEQAGTAAPAKEKSEKVTKPATKKNEEATQAAQEAQEAQEGDQGSDDARGDETGASGDDGDTGEASGADEGDADDSSEPDDAKDADEIEADFRAAKTLAEMREKIELYGERIEKMSPFFSKPLMDLGRQRLRELK